MTGRFESIFWSYVKQKISMDRCASWEVATKQLTALQSQAQAAKGFRILGGVSAGRQHPFADS